MPLYDYHCPACDASFEDVRPMNDSQPPACPTCGKPAVRQMSAVHLKTNPFPFKGHKDTVRMMPPAARGGLAKPNCGGCGNSGANSGGKIG